jgi:hypothetical protein
MESVTKESSSFIVQPVSAEGEAGLLVGLGLLEVTCVPSGVIIT